MDKRILCVFWRPWPNDNSAKSLWKDQDGYWLTWSASISYWWSGPWQVYIFQGCLNFSKNSSKFWTQISQWRPVWPYNPQFIKIAWTEIDIKNWVNSLRETLGGHRIVRFDCEWKVLFRQRNMGGQDKVALIQICYIGDEGHMWVLVFMLYCLDVLPGQLETFLLD